MAILLGLELEMKLLTDFNMTSMEIVQDMKVGWNLGVHWIQFIGKIIRHLTAATGVRLQLKQ